MATLDWYHRRMVYEAPRRKLTYRPDIDGLRAVAVLLVVARHLRITRFSGGFVGVDVFFVISGYLISAMIMPQIAAGTFSLMGFYERRVRRIFPALFVMLAMTSAVAWRFLLPTEMVAFSHSLAAALFGVSNFVFWSWAGYFDGPNELKPLLHTWSLGVEEQFYLVFPLLLLMTRWMRPRALRAAVWALTAVSLIAGCWMTRRLPANGFFLAPLRAWELLFGIVIAQRYVPAIAGAIVRNVAAFAGLAMIVAAGLSYNSHTVFPGLAAIPPCLGAALVIAAGETGSSFAGKALSWRPVVFLGLISYSLYLWHWPVQVFWDYAHLLDGRKENDWRGIAWVFSISMMLAVASWALVERPVRVGRFRPGRRVLFGGAGVLAGAGLLAAICLGGSDGAPWRFPAEAVRVAAYLDYNNHYEDRWGTCAVGPLVTNLRALTASEECLPYRHGARHFLLVGDSHAAMIWPGLAEAFPEFDIGQMNMSECPMMIGLGTAAKTCGDLSKFLYQQYLPAHPMEALLVSYRWLDSDMKEVDALVAYARTHGTKVIVFGPTVEYTMPLPRLLAISITDGKGVDEVQQHEERRPRELDRQMARLARERWGVEYVSFFADVCGGSECPVEDNAGMPTIFDANHLTKAWAVHWMREVKERGELR